MKKISTILKALSTAYFILFSITTIQAELVINEVMPCNLSTYIDEESLNFCPYAELHNSGDTIVNLEGYNFSFISTEDTTTYSATIEGNYTIPAGGYFLFYFDKLTTGRHLGFKLDADGGTISLHSPSGDVESSLKMPSMCAHVSYGRGFDGELGYMEPSPNSINNTAYAAKSLTDLNINYRCSKPQIETATNVIDDDSASVTITCSTPDATIYYTTNGQEPTPYNANVYEDTLTFYTGATIRARAFANNLISSEINTQSLIFNDEQHSYCSGVGVLPIVSISTDIQNFENDTFGIMVDGLAGEPNYRKEWKRPANFEFIVDGKTVASYEIETKVMGAGSREYLPRSISLSAGKKCGSGKNKMKFAFFNDFPEKKKFKSLQLRNGGQDYYDLRFRDGFVQTLAHNTSIDHQAYQPVAYYINGKYIGLMGLYEHATEDYLYTNYDLDDEDVDFIKNFEATSGDKTAYNDLIKASSEGQNSGSYYSKMDKLMDMEEYMTYTAFQQYVGNTDWPGNNLKLWRNKNNGRFRWILYDTDYAFAHSGGNTIYDAPSIDMINFCMGEGNVITWANGSLVNGTYVFDEDSKYKTELFSNLMKDNVFRNKFLTRYLLLVEHDFSPKTILAAFDSIAELAYPEYCATWSKPDSLPLYSENDRINAIKQFATARPQFVYQQLADHFGGEIIDAHIYSNIQNVNFNINGIYWDRDEYNSKFISNNTLSVSAIAPEGYRLKHWEYNVSKSLLGPDSPWLYLYNDTTAPADWNKDSCNTDGWDSGFGKMGYGTNSYNTIINKQTDPQNQIITGYFRNTITIDTIDNHTKLLANIVYDDAYILYVNGVEVRRGNISAPNINHLTPADKSVNDVVERFEIDPKHFFPGTNIIAVEVHQSHVSEDFTFAFNLNMQNSKSLKVVDSATFTDTVPSSFSLQAVFEELEDTAVEKGILINEICTSNKQVGGYADSFGKHGDWIELYNNSDHDINVAGWFISDNEKKPDKYRIPLSYPDSTLIPANGYKIIWCDNEVWNGPTHVNFKLTEGAKNTITISRTIDSTITPMDIVSVPANLGANNSYGRISDGDDSWTLFAQCSEGYDSPLPTPNLENGSLSCTQSYNEIAFTSKSKQISVYPNPASNELNINSNSEPIKSISISDITGRIIQKTTCNGKEIKTNVSALPCGIYTISIEIAQSIERLKFIKK